MTKTQKKWFKFGQSDTAWVRGHPEAVCQEAWGYSLKDIEDNLLTWGELYDNFPFYRKGSIEAAKIWES